jgi:hypothetical protein
MEDRNQPACADSYHTAITDKNRRPKIGSRHDYPLTKPTDISIDKSTQYHLFLHRIIAPTVRGDDFAF